MRVARLRAVAIANFESEPEVRLSLRLEGVRDVLEKKQAERDVLVVGRFQVLA